MSSKLQEAILKGISSKPTHSKLKLEGEWVSMKKDKTIDFGARISYISQALNHILSKKPVKTPKQEAIEYLEGQLDEYKYQPGMITFIKRELARVKKL